MRDLVKAVKESNWTEANILKHPDHYKVRDYLTLLDSLMFKRGTRFVPAPRNRTQVIYEAHGLHIGLTRMKARLAEAFWWPRWWKDVEQFVNDCLEC